MSKLSQLLVLTLTILNVNNTYCWEWPNVWPFKILKPKFTTFTIMESSIAYEKNENGEMVPLADPERDFHKINTIKQNMRKIPIGYSKEAERNYIGTHEGNYPGNLSWRVTKKETQRAQQEWDTKSTAIKQSGNRTKMFFDTLRRWFGR